MTILNNSNNKNNNSNNNSNNSNNNENDSEIKNESVNENENENEKDNVNDDDKYEIKQINNYFKMIDKTTLFKEQINLLRKMHELHEYWYMRYDYDKEINLKIFELKYAYLSEDLDEKLFEEVFGHTFVTLADKLINTINKEENQIIVSDIKKNKDKLYEQDDFHKFVIHPNYKRIDLIDAAKLILEFNKTIQLDGD